MKVSLVDFKNHVMEFIKNFFYVREKILKKLFYLYSHFFIIVNAVFLGFMIIGLFLYFFIKGVFLKLYFIPISFLIFSFFVPYIVDMLSRGIYDYPFFAMTFLQKDKFNFNFINMLIYKYVKFCFFLHSFFIFSALLFSLMAGIHMIIFSELICSFNAYIGYIIVLISFIPMALELFSYSWFNKTFYI